MQDEAPSFSRVHFIGIGGAGMSGIALVLHERGLMVSGSDLKSSRYVRQLERAGIPVTLGHKAETVDEAKPDIVVISSAIPPTNPELTRAKELGIEVWRRAQMLSALCRGRTTVAVAGTHGKTTTSSMIASMLDGMGLDPSFLIGGVVEGFDTNGKNGSGKFFVAEADESDESFLFLDPDVVVVTNVEEDHLDHYHTLDAIRDAFVRFMALTGPQGTVVCCGEDPELVAMAAKSGVRTMTYGRGESFDYLCEPLQTPGAVAITTPGGVTVEVQVSANPGVHNLLNATAALAVADVLGLDVEQAARALSHFKGVKRRFSVVGIEQGITVVDDYGHHPTEVKATLKAARELPYERVVVAFQPHRYSRTEALAEQFGEAFDNADEVLILDVFAAGELPIPGVSGRTIAQAILNHNPQAHVSYVPDRRKIVDALVDLTQPGDLLITMGAGDVSMLGPEFLERLEEDAGEN